MQQLSSSSETNSSPSAFGNSGKVRLEEYLCLGGAYLMFRLPWLFMLPMVEAPDEFAHHWVIKFLTEHHRLPMAKEVFDGGASAVYGSLPQMGYIPHVFISSLFPIESIALTERLGSLFMGAWMMLAAYYIGKLLFPKSLIAALALPAAIILHPQLVFIHSYANCDSTSSALASIILWLSFESLSSGLRFNRTMIIGALSGWVAISKYAGLAILPVVAIPLIASIFLNGTSLLAGLASFVAAGVLAVVVSAWWFYQNNTQYPGDFSGTQTMFKSWAVANHKPLSYYLPASHIIKDHKWWRLTMFSYWSLFGYMTRYIWRPVYWIYGFYMLLATVAPLTQVALATMRSKLAVKGKGKPLIMWFSLALCLTINIALMIAASTKNLGGPQGRYLITSEIPIMALIIGGLMQCGAQTKSIGRWKLSVGEIAVLSFLLFNAAVTIGSWIHLFRLYGGWHLDPLVM